jgi:hypothetical protein
MAGLKARLQHTDLEIIGGPSYKKRLLSRAREAGKVSVEKYPYCDYFTVTVIVAANWLP